MTTVLGTCYVGRHDKGTGYVVLRFKSNGNKYPVFSMVGPVVNISNEKMATSGLSIVSGLARDALTSTAKVLSFFDESTKKEMLKLKRNHVLVSIAILLPQDGVEQMKIIPFHGRRGFNFDARAEEVMIFPLPKTNDEFLKKLNEAFDIAS